MDTGVRAIQGRSRYTVEEANSTFAKRTAKKRTNLIESDPIFRFDSCVEIADAKKRMNEVFYASLNAKTSIAQQKILDIQNISSPEGQQEKQKIIAAINAEEFVFEPNEPKERVFRSLQLMGRLSNTVAFEKLKKIGGINA